MMCGCQQGKQCKYHYATSHLPEDVAFSPNQVQAIAQVMKHYDPDKYDRLVRMHDAKES